MTSYSDQFARIHSEKPAIKARCVLCRRLKGRVIRSDNGEVGICVNCLIEAILDREGLAPAGLSKDAILAALSS